jgi:hypothetical protein
MHRRRAAGLSVRGPIFAAMHAVWFIPRAQKKWSFLRGLGPFGGRGASCWGWGRSEPVEWGAWVGWARRAPRLR